MMKTLFLHPPSFDGFDGGAGARYQARREITSYWFPTWLAQPAALVPGSRLMDAPPHQQTLEDVLALAQTQAVKQKLADNTAKAVERGVFGLPAFFVGKEMFWGKERLGQVEEAVAAEPARG